MTNWQKCYAVFKTFAESLLYHSQKLEELGKIRDTGVDGIFHIGRRFQNFSRYSNLPERYPNLNIPILYIHTYSYTNFTDIEKPYTIHTSLSLIII
ncbi:hypothetical protein Avbf_03878 [Armadillidium vulgare]|nr:hypothetical protein Avbf_03878 [Armadillidium vulgare]